MRAKLPRIIGGHFDGETRRVVVAGGAAGDAVVESLPGDGLHGKVEVVVDKLAPLHHHVAGRVVHRHPFARNQLGRDQTSARQPVPVV